MKRREMERRERVEMRIGDLNLGFPYGLPPAIFECLSSDSGELVLVLQCFLCFLLSSHDRSYFFERGQPIPKIIYAVICIHAELRIIIKKLLHKHSGEVNLKELSFSYFFTLFPSSFSWQKRKKT